MTSLKIEQSELRFNISSLSCQIICTVEPLLTHTSRWMAQAMGY
jgi:hypothetical protein